jgi:hypothetical protein
VSESRGWLAANPHWTSWLKGLETEISTAGLDFKGLVLYPFLFVSFLFQKAEISSKKNILGSVKILSCFFAKVFP